MVRAPCCDKLGLKKGPWSHEEDRILMDYVNLHGHPNWRALPKLAGNHGLLRCGKSCRLRWTNYLRPDLKRGNFSKEEEDTIIQLHTSMGNRWSAIAARLPGRTDNEIKNVWHTHLKKRVKENSNHDDSKTQQKVEEDEVDNDGSSPLEANSSSQMSYNQLDSPVQPSSTITSRDNSLCMEDMVVDTFMDMDDEFWSEIFSGDELTKVHGSIDQSPISLCGYGSNTPDDLDFWFNVLTRTDETIEI